MENLKLRLVQAKAKLGFSLGLTVACSACFHENEQYFGKLAQGGDIVVPSPQASPSADGDVTNGSHENSNGTAGNEIGTDGNSSAGNSIDDSHPSSNDDSIDDSHHSSNDDSDDDSHHSSNDNSDDDSHHSSNDDSDDNSHHSSNDDSDDDHSNENSETPTVCDPFNTPNDQNGEVLTTDHGLKATLKYMTAANLKKYPHTSVQNYIDYGTKASADIYFSSVNVPTRKFDEGFVSDQGTPLKDDSGKTLIENFSLQFESNIRFSKGTEKMKVQFAVISDDGANVHIKSGSNWQTLINNDGHHPSKMGCASTPVEISAESSLPIKIDYYQGPRYHIAVVLLWREWKEDSHFEWEDVMCGKNGNSLFYDSEFSPPRESSAHLSLLGRGWKVVPKEVYYLDAAISSNDTKSNSKVNPCNK